MMGGERENNHCPEVVTHRGYIITLYQNISQNSQESTFAGVSFLINLRTVGVQLHGVFIRLQYRYSPMNFTKFITTTFLENKFAWLLRLYNEPEHPVLMISIFFAANPEGIYDRFRLRILSVCHWRFRTEHGATRKINDNFCKEKVHSKTKLDFITSLHSHPAFTCSDSTKETPE